MFPNDQLRQWNYMTNGVNNIITETQTTQQEVPIGYWGFKNRNIINNNNKIKKLIIIIIVRIVLSDYNNYNCCAFFSLNFWGSFG